MKLSKRLEMVASFVQEGSNLADVGTDHGYIPIALVSKGVVKSAIAMDVRKGPLERAKEHIFRHRLEDRIETRLSDGVMQLNKGEADAVVIAGMGGELVIHILEEGRHLWEDIGQWVLSPQSELDKVRHYLKDSGFLITKESMIFEEGKYYTVMNVIRGEMEEMTPAGYLYGKCLIRDKNPSLKAFLEKERAQLEKILEQLYGQESQASRERTKALKEQLRWIEEAQDEMR